MNPEWEDEPSDSIFVHQGIRCVIKRQPTLKYLMGFIIVDRSHHWFGAHSAELSGILSGRHIISYADHAPFGRDNPDEWWIGFSCNQPFDLVPYEWEQEGASYPRLFKNHKYADFGYVERHLKELANKAAVVNAFLKV